MRLSSCLKPATGRLTHSSPAEAPTDQSSVRRRAFVFCVAGQFICAATLYSVLACVFSACRTSPPDVEPGPDRTVAHYLAIESSEPGVNIETNGVAAGKTPFRLKVFGDAGGTFHNFGNPQFVLRALPLSSNQFLQTKVFRTGIRSAPGDRIPGVMFFDMTQPTGAMQIDSIPDR